MMDFAIVNLTSLRSSGTNGRIPSREWAMGEGKKGGAVGKMRGRCKIIGDWSVELLETVV